ncbi:unnamed protein product [Rotaria sp. Silwood1]|nr:unnamed protein product [Rotaria sp. Silwood1]CAF3333700.1 unnamed protein product [Rotaria sp. Silwood1]CAF4691974.1 unnamed protein product [Rotaria sp. Silwood1]
MDNSNALNETSIQSSYKKKAFFIGIVVFVIILSTQFFESSTRRKYRLEIHLTKHLFKLIKRPSAITTSTTTSTATSTTVPTTTSTTTSKSTSIQITSTTSKSTSIQITSTTSKTTTNFDEVLCDNMTKSANIHISDNPCERIRCAVIVRNIAGRLGNRMFIFASAYGLARAHNCRLHVSKRILDELSMNFQMKQIDQNMWLSDEEVNTLKDITTRYSGCTFIPELLIPNAFKTLEIIGYWQSYLYFDAYREEIREVFRSRNETLSRLAEYLTKITYNICSTCLPLPNTTHQELRQAFQTRYNITWISIHIRLRDFRGLRFSSDDNYLRRAILIFRRRYHRSQVRFLVASDDKEYCEKLFYTEQQTQRIFILPRHFSPADDMMALSLCHHSIVTGGTYGFWSAYLAGGEVIHDIRYITGCLRSDYFPPWFMLIAPLASPKV